jgi:hypothetical protein
VALFVWAVDGGLLGSAGLAGEGSDTFVAFLGGSDGLEGNTGGDALTGGGNAWLGITLRFEVMAARVALFCSSCFFGGRGGSFEGSYAGART